MRSSGMTLELTETGTRDESPLVALTAHRLLGESLTNALKHGDLSAPVRVDVEWTDGYRLSVTNALSLTNAVSLTNVVGRDVTGDEHEPGSGHGLVGMAERTTVAGGTFSAGREGDHWVVTAHLPVHPLSLPTVTPAGGDA